MQFSTTTTAPSTMMPKSIAPRLIRFADTSNAFIAVIMQSADSGIAAATIRPARRLPTSSSSMTTTSTAPLLMFSTTVSIVRPISSVRS